MTNRLRSVALLFILLVSSPIFAQKKPAAGVKRAVLGTTRNVHVCAGLFLAGQPQEADIAKIKAKGIRRIVSLRRKGEVTWDEPKTVKQAALEFVRVPFGATDSLTDEVFQRVRQLLRESKKTPTMLHCGSANRVGAVWLAYRVLDERVTLKQAIREARQVGLRSAAYERIARDYIRRGGKEQSVRPGINKRFLDSKMKVGEWVARFEGESREIFSSRTDILKSLKIRAGMHVADIGAGTGFFSALMGRRVGPSGWVYAVDISPRFIQHIATNSARAGIKNLTPVLCAEDSVRLAPGSIDLAFVCDVYHHFEYPRSTLRSLYRAMRDKSTLVVIDFERIPGKSRKFVLGHVRAGKKTFKQEIESAGFRFVEEVKIKGLTENYFLRFRKSAKKR